MKKIFVGCFFSEGHSKFVKRSLICVLVTHVEYLLLESETSVVVTEVRLVEWLGLVKPVSVGRAHLISVRVNFCAPARAVPMLAVHGVARTLFFQRLLLEVSIFHTGASRVAMLVHVVAEEEQLGRIKGLNWVAIAEIGLCVDLRVVEASSRRRVFVVGGMVGWVREVPGLCSVTA